MATELPPLIPGDEPPETEHVRPRARPVADSSGLFRRIVAGLAGYDLQLVPLYAGTDAEHERKRLVRIGMSVAVPAFLMLFTTFFGLASSVEVLPTRIVFSIMASLLFLVIDSIVVTTLTKNSGMGTLVRILISVCMGIVVTEPILTLLYSKTIDAHITSTVEYEREERLGIYSAQLHKDDEASARDQGELKNDLQGLAELTPDAAAAHRQIAQQERNDDIARRARASQDQELANLYAQRTPLEAQKSQLDGQIEAKNVAMLHESQGKGPSGVPGHGDVYKAMQAALRGLTDDRDRITALIAGLDAKIDARLHDSAREAQAATPSGSDDVEQSGVGSDGLTTDEHLKKEALEADVDAVRIDLAQLRDDRERTNQAIARLPDEFSLSKRNDTLAQTAALYEILAANWFLRIKVTALFLLLFLADIAPVVIKLTVVTGYERYFKTLLAKQYVQDAPIFDAHHYAVCTAGTRKINRLNALAKTTMDGLAAADIRGFNESRIRAISIKHARAVEREADVTLARAADQSTPPKKASLWGWLISALRAGYWALRQKFGA